MKSKLIIQVSDDYESAASIMRQLNLGVKEASSALKCYDQFRGPTGLTPDHIKATPEWKSAKNWYERCAKLARDYAQPFIKKHKKQWVEELRAHRRTV